MIVFSFVLLHLWITIQVVVWQHIYVPVSVAFILMPIPGISSSLLTIWPCLDSKSAMNRFGPGLYRILMLYWWMCSSILIHLCDRLTSSSLKFVTSALWSVNTLPWQIKQLMWNLSRLLDMPRFFLLMFLYQFFALIRLRQVLLAIMQLCWLLYSVGTAYDPFLWGWHLLHLPRYSCSFSLLNAMNLSFLVMDFAPWCRIWYVYSISIHFSWCQSSQWCSLLCS